MPPIAIGLDPAGLDAVCPFHLVLDGALRLVRTGPVVGRLVPGLVPGVLAVDHFRLRQPPGGWSAERLRARAGQLVLLVATTEPRLVLKGQFVPADHGHLIFIGGPSVTRIALLADLGLTFDDFPAHDGITDQLLVMQAQEASLADARALADRLGSLNRDLEQRVAERTRSLAERGAELERLNARLQDEVNERQRIEADLRLAQKLEAVGQLAAGIAHEINTPVQFVGDNLRFLGDAFTDLQRVLDAHRDLLAELDRSATAAAAMATSRQAVAEVEQAADLDWVQGEVPKALAQSLDGIERVTQIVRAMKEFSHQDRGGRIAVDLNQALATTLVVARNEYKYVAEVVTILDPALPPVPCFLGELNQVFLNLIVNAAHAISDRMAGSDQRGTITIRNQTIPDPGGSGQPWVEIGVRDTGTGIPPEVQGRIFEPFFTTKEVGRGTGQGLTLARTIVTKRHGGTLHFTTEPGVGTEFVIRLPLAGDGGTDTGGDGS